MVSTRKSTGKYDVRYFNTKRNALIYRGTMDIHEFKNSGVYRLKNKGSHEFLYGYRVGYPSQ